MQPGAIQYKFGCENVMFAQRTPPLVVALITFVVGCSTENSKMDAKGKKPDDKTIEIWESKSDFFIGKTNFGIQANESRFEVTKTADGQFFLTVEVNGNDTRRDELRDDEKSGWSTIPCSPLFYLRKYPVSAMPNDPGLTIKLKPADYDRFDVALYLGEHNHVTGVEITVSEQQIEISGRANLEAFGKHDNFRIRWLKK
jgi:hypothetical protein